MKPATVRCLTSLLAPPGGCFLILAATTIAASCGSRAAEPLGAEPSPAIARRWRQVLSLPDAWFCSPEAIRVADAVLLHQRRSGGWPKNTNMAQPPPKAERDALLDREAFPDSTIDNGATVTEIRLLARVFGAQRQERHRRSLLRGLDFLLSAQYANGGWPQYFPLRDDYSRHITFNDGAMIGVMELLREVGRGLPPFLFVDEDRRARARAAVARGVRLILSLQIRVHGQRTAWCAQHHEETLAPAGARTYEHPSISGQETVGIVSFLMTEPDPTPEIIAAVDAAVAWLRLVSLRGSRVERIPAPDLPGGVDVIVQPDPEAPPLWARFYEIGTNRPIFSGRDGVIRRHLAEIEHERRSGYAWLGTWPQVLIDESYPAWRMRSGSRPEGAHP